MTLTVANPFKPISSKLNNVQNGIVKTQSTAQTTPATTNGLISNPFSNTNVQQRLGTIQNAPINAVLNVQQPKLQATATSTNHFATPTTNYTGTVQNAPVSNIPVSQPQAQATNSTGISANQQAYLTKLAQTGSLGEKQWAYQQLSKAGVKTNEQQYLEKLASSDNIGQSQWANTQLKQLGLPTVKSNQQVYLENLVKTGDSGAKTWATQQLQKNGWLPQATPSKSGATTNNPQVNNQVQYLQNLATSGTVGEQSWAHQQLQKLGYEAKPVSLDTGSYNNLPSVDTLQKYADQKAQNQFENEKLGYEQLIAADNLKKGQLMTNQQIEDEANRMMQMKYGSQFDTLNNQYRTNVDNYNLQKADENNNYQKAVTDVHNTAFNQRQDAASSANARGLFMSSVLDNSVNQINNAETQGLSAQAQTFQTNINKLDTAINDSIQALNDQWNTLTKDQQAYLTDQITTLTKARDDQQQQLDLDIRQQMDKENQARNNIGQNSMDNFNQIYTPYANLNQQNLDRQEKQNEFKQNLALQYAQLAAQNARAAAANAKSSGGSGKKSSGSGGSSTYKDPNAPSGKSSSGSSGSSSSSVQWTPQDVINLGQGPINLQNGYDQLNKISTPQQTPVKNPFGQVVIGGNPLTNRGILKG